MTQERAGTAPVEDTQGALPDRGYAQRMAEGYQGAFPHLEALSIEVAQGVHIAYHAMHEARTRLINSFGLGRVGGRYSALRTLYLASESYLTPQELAERLMITAASVTFLIDGLEKDGLVVRTVDQRDRRSRRIGLTDRGREVCGQLIPAIGELFDRYCRGFTEEEKLQFAEYLLRFWQNARAEAGH